MKLTDANGKVVASYTYGVYGELLSGDTKLTHFLYNGRCGVSTDDNGLYYMRQRYYNPEIKRFINQDILTGSMDNSQSLNRYSYVQGNPVSYTDPFGLSPVNGLFSNSNGIHGTLMVAGFAPGPGGMIADLADSFLYLLEGDMGGAIGASMAIFVGGAGLAYKSIKAAGKANKISDTAKLVKNTTNALSNSGNFLNTAMDGADAAKSLKAVKQGSVVDRMKDAVSATGNKFKSSRLALNNSDAVDTRIVNPSKWDEMKLDGGVLNISKKAKMLQEGGNGTIVEVKSFSEADSILEEAFPNYQKVKGIGAQDANGIRKKNKLDRFKQGGAYHKDYAVNKETGRIYGHAEGNPHGQYPHINIKRTDGKNVMINIIRGKK